MKKSSSRQAKIEVREAIADIIKDEGVEYVFGHTGGHIRQLWDALVQKKFKTVFNKIEGNGVFAAMGHYQQSGQVGVVLGTSGPGVQNMVMAAASAHLDSIPIILIGAAVPTYIAGKNALQDSSGIGRSVKQREIFQACIKAAYTVSRAQDTVKVFREAFYVARSGRPGPVFVEVPSDFWRKKISYRKVKTEKVNFINKFDDKKIREIAQKLYESNNPIIVIGEGAAIGADVKDKLNAFLRKLFIPFAASPLAKDLVNEQDEFYVGTLRSTPGVRLVYHYLKKVDLVLSLGNRFEQWEWDWMGKKENVIPKARIIQVDYDETEIGRVFSADYALVSTIDNFIDNFPIKKHKKSDDLLQSLKKLREKIKSNYKDQKAAHPVNLIKVLQKVMPNNTCVVSDTGNIGSMVITRFKTSSKQRFLHAQRNSPMGYAVPASLGAAFKHQGPVLCVVGDGSFNMTGNELALLLNYKLKVIFVIANDGSCSMIESGNYAEFGYTNMTNFKNPDYLKMADAYGLKAYRVDSSIKLEKAMMKALNDIKHDSVVIDVTVNYPDSAWQEMKK